MTSVKRNHRLSKFSLIAGLFFALIVLVSSAAYAQDKDLSFEDLSKTDAAQKYIAHQYDESLAEFQKLEKEHPNNVLIKRYIASLLDTLRRTDEAASKLLEILNIKDDDVIARQMLGDIYMKQVDLDNAEQQFQILVEKSPGTPSGVYAQKKLEELRHLKSTAKTQTGQSLSAQDFMKTAAAQNFSRGKYAEALEGFNELQQNYPKDALAGRFRAITLSRLGRKDEAILAFRDTLQFAPDNVALHFYLAETYLEKGNAEDARKEYQWVVAHDETGYRYRAEQSLFRTLGRGPAAASLRPWSLGLTQGYDYDTNATYSSRDPDSRSPGDRNSSRFNTTLTGTYRFYQKGRWFLMGDSFYAQSLYTDFPTLRTTTPGAGLTAFYTFNFFNKPAFFSLREGISNTNLRDKWYVFNQTLNPTLIFNFYKKLKTTISNRWSYSEYKNDGTNRDATDRDGFANTISLANSWYFDDLRTRYTTFTYDYEYNPTDGLDYVKHAHGVKLDLHSPLFEKVEGEFSFRFRDSDFPYFTAGPPDRRDDLYSLTTTLTRPLNSYLSLSAAYSYERVFSQNHSYEYQKNLFTVQLSIRY